MDSDTLVGFLQHLRIDFRSLSDILQCTPVVAQFQLGQGAMHVAGNVCRIEPQSLVEI